MQLMRTGVLERIAAGHVVTGVIVCTGRPVVVELCTAAGLDFVSLDMEHSALDLTGAAHLIRAADASGIAAYIRVPTSTARSSPRFITSSPWRSSATGSTPIMAGA